MSYPAASTITNRLRSSAYRRREFRSGEACYPSVSIYSLIANPNSYEGVPLVIFGHMGVDGGRAYIYPTKNSYDGMETISSIQFIHDNFDNKDLAKLTSLSRKNIRAYGVFSVKYDPSRLGRRVGSITLHGVPEYLGNRIMDKDSTEIYTIIRDIPELDE